MLDGKTVSVIRGCAASRTPDAGQLGESAASSEVAKC